MKNAEAKGRTRFLLPEASGGRRPDTCDGEQYGGFRSQIVIDTGEQRRACLRGEKNGHRSRRATNTEG